MFIVQIQANPSGSRPPLQSWSSANPPDGYAFLTDEQKDIFYSTTPAGFVNITIEEQEGIKYVSQIEVNQEALDAFKATLPDPTDSIKAEKIAEIKKDCEDYIYAGTSVTYSDGNTEHFTYNLAEAAYDNAKYCYACYVGLSSNPAALADSYMVKIAQEHYDRYQVFNTIVMHLNGILKDNACSNSTLVRYYLQEMVAAIRWKKVAFNNGYFITLPKEHDKAYVKQERRQYNDGYKSYQDDSGLKGFFKQPDQTNL